MSRDNISEKCSNLIKMAHSSPTLSLNTLSIAQWSDF